MTTVGWLVDDTELTGGAELSQAEFRAAAPDGVEVVDCPAGAVAAGLDRYVVHNCVTYTVGDLEATASARVVKVWHDVGPWVDPQVRNWLDTFADAVCCSPAQANYMGLEDAHLIPPPVDLERFRAAATASHGRLGACSIGSWHNPGKAPHRVAEWARSKGGRVDFFGDGPFAPEGCQMLAYQDVADVLASYHTFVFLPQVIEPFGRTVAEAWAAGCEIVTNGLVGAAWWIEQSPRSMDSAARDFWEVVLA